MIFMENIWIRCIGTINLGLVDSEKNDTRSRIHQNLKWDLIILVVLDAVGIKSRKFIESIEQDDLYMVLGLATVMMREEA